VREVRSNAHLDWQRRLALVRPLMELAQRPISERRRATPAGLPVTLEGLAANIARKYGVGRRSLWRWYSRLQAEGPLGLARSPRRDCGSSRFFASHPQMAAFARQLLNHHTPPLLVFKALRARCAMKAARCCSYETVRAEAARLRGGATSRRLQ
jgi:hypothetical protein